MDRSKFPVLFFSQTVEDAVETAVDDAVENAVEDTVEDTVEQATSSTIKRRIIMAIAGLQMKVRRK